MSAPPPAPTHPPNRLWVWIQWKISETMKHTRSSMKLQTLNRCRTGSQRTHFSVETRSTRLCGSRMEPLAPFGSWCVVPLADLSFPVYLKNRIEPDWLQIWTVTKTVQSEEESTGSVTMMRCFIASIQHCAATTRSTCSALVYGVNYFARCNNFSYAQTPQKFLYFDPQFNQFSMEPTRCN